MAVLLTGFMLLGGIANGASSPQLNDPAAHPDRETLQGPLLAHTSHGDLDVKDVWSGKGARTKVAACGKGFQSCSGEHGNRCYKSGVETCTSGKVCGQGYSACVGRWGAAKAMSPVFSSQIGNVRPA